MPFAVIRHCYSVCCLIGYLLEIRALNSYKSMHNRAPLKRTSGWKMTTHSDCSKKNVNCNKTNVHDFQCEAFQTNDLELAEYYTKWCVDIYLERNTPSTQTNKQTDERPGKRTIEWMNEWRKSVFSFLLRLNSCKFTTLRLWPAKQTLETKDWNIYSIEHDPMRFYYDLTLVNRAIVHAHNGR